MCVAAHRLGAPYPFHHDKLAAKQFDQYLLTIHGQPRAFGFNKMTLFSCVLAPFMAIFGLSHCLWQGELKRRLYKIGDLLKKMYQL
jgi:hypothetical protein